MKRYLRALAVASLAFAACGARTGLAVGDADVTPPRDAGRDMSAPRDLGADARVVCDFGEVTADVHGRVTSWNGGAPLPAGHYRVAFVDGCMKYSGGQDWTIHAYADGSYAFWIVSGTTRVVMTPGTVGIFAGSGGFASFDACVAANASDPIVDFDFHGGPLAVQLVDSPYEDNVDGPGGRNPTWKLSACD